MATILRNLKLSSVEALSVVDKGASGNDALRPRIVLYKRAEPAPSKSIVDRMISLFRKAAEEAAAEPQPQEKAMPEEMLAAIMGKLSPEEQDYLKQLMAQKAAADEAKADEPKPDDEMAKRAALPEEVRKQLDELTVLKRELEHESFMKRAADLDHLPGLKREEMAEILKSASKGMKPEQFASLEKALKSAAEAVRKSGLFDERGSSMSGEASAYEQLRAVAKSLQEKDPTLTDSVAITKAAEIRKDLAKKYQEEAR